MKKNVVQDVIPPKKSIRNVEVPFRSKEVQDAIDKQKKVSFERPVVINKQPIVNIPPKPIPPPPPIFIPKAPTPIPPPITPPAPPIPPPKPREQYTYEYKEPGKKSKKWLYIFSTLFLIVVAFAISAFFRSAEIRITPKTDTKTMDETFTAKKDVTSPALGFQVVTVTKEVDKTLDATIPTSNQQVDRKARGTIVIYNNYSSEPQKLVATTRFQTPEGLIFRLITGVTVPGKQIKAGKSVAGSVQVTVEADKTGASYNVQLKDFTLPGLKGDPKYTDIYARSKTEMSGGFSGMQKSVSSAVLDSANNEMQISLQNSLSKDIISQIPTDFLLYTSSLNYKFDPVTQSNDTTGNVVLKKKGVATAIIFNRGDLTRTVLDKILPNVDNSMIKIVNLSILDFSLQTASSTLSSDTTSVTFNLKGDANLVWVLDENKLKSDLLGLSKSNAKVVIGTYSTVKEAWILTRPFWNQTIPNDSNKVTLVNTLTP